MKIAIVGTGISGLVCAHLLHPDHDLTIYEAGATAGGHTHTVDVEQAGRSYAVDTGFIVFNDWTYPNFIKLLARLGVASQPSSMSFSVKCERTGLEYNGTSMNGLFAQRRNLVNPRFWGMLRDILRFGREAPRLLESDDDSLTLGAYLEQNHYGPAFVEHYILPMGAAIWSARREEMWSFPARFFVRFFKNHGMLNVNDRPQWRVVQGGSREYVRKLIQPLQDRIRLNSPVTRIERHDDHVLVTASGGAPQRFDQVIVAAHSDQALKMLADPSDEERAILGAMGYQANAVVLHTDEAILPRRRRAWAAWNYLLPRDEQARNGRATVTYDMNILQGLDAPRTFCVTLNRTEALAPEHILRQFVYDHPVFTTAAVAAQGRRAAINGVRRTWFCGAYWGFGFHEDGVNSALAVTEQFGRSL